jgi:hypothetical protein
MVNGNQSHIAHHWYCFWSRVYNTWKCCLFKHFCISKLHLNIHAQKSGCIKWVITDIQMIRRSPCISKNRTEIFYLLNVYVTIDIILGKDGKNWSQSSSHIHWHAAQWMGAHKITNHNTSQTSISHASTMEAMVRICQSTINRYDDSLSMGNFKASQGDNLIAASGLIFSNDWDGFRPPSFCNDNDDFLPNINVRAPDYEYRLPPPTDPCKRGQLYGTPWLCQTKQPNFVRHKIFVS